VPSAWRYAIGSTLFSAIVALLCTGASVFAVPFNSISLSDIEAASLSPATINGSDNSNNQIPTGTILLYKTDVQRYGKLQIASYGYNLSMNWVTYNADGSVYSSGQNLVIHGTWSCDLDSGTETLTPSSSDFWWLIGDAVRRYFVPEDGAEFAVYASSGTVPETANSMFLFGLGIAALGGVKRFLRAGNN
jgi:hypothetical protein